MHGESSGGLSCSGLLGGGMSDLNSNPGDMAGATTFSNLEFEEQYEYTSVLNSGLSSVATNEECIKVDRRRLESMLQENSGEPETAEHFFQRVMDETSTQISWPSKLKVGGKSKKDPHIKIYGEPDAILTAKAKILEIFDTKKNKVTLKMDVSYTDHSHIIGKGGHTIQQVMDETGCHIHFPDSNRNANAEKSNQVSIAGPAVGVEKARCRIRNLLPLVLTFEVPHSVPDFTTSTIQMIFRSFGFTATPRQTINNTNLILVRGSCRQLAHIRQGLLLLMNLLAGTGAVFPVTLRTEISPQHHNFVMGPLASNIKMIMRATGAAITFPDPNTASTMMHPNLPYQTKSTVSISGKFDSVYAAWQLLIGYLPLVMMFDLKEGQDISPVLLAQLTDLLKVTISVRPKRKENVKTVIVRCPENSSRSLFEVRRRLLELDDSEVPNCCERHSVSNPLGGFISSPLHPDISNMQHKEHKFPIANNLGHLLNHPALQQNSSPTSLGGWPNQQVPVGTLYNPTSPSSPTLLTLLLSQLAVDSSAPTGPFSPQNAFVNSYAPDFGQAKFSSPWERGGSSSGGFSTPNMSPRNSPIHFQREMHPSNVSYKHPSENMRNLWHQPPKAASSLDSFDQLSNSSYTTTSSSNPQSDLTASGNSLCSNFKDNASLGYGSMTDLNDLSDTKSFLPSESSCGQSSIDLSIDYEDKKLLATRAIQKPIGSEVRTPTNVWSGCGFSKSMPQVLKENPSLLRILQNYKALQGNNSTNSHDNKISNLDSIWSSSSNSFPTQTQSASDQDSSDWNANLFHPNETNSSTNVDTDEESCSSLYTKGLFASSNKFESVISAPMQLGPNSDFPSILIQAGLTKYIDTFIELEIDKETFLTMTDSDFQDLNVPFGARRKLTLLQKEMCKSKRFDAAPGAERRTLRSTEDLKEALARAKQCW